MHWSTITFHLNERKIFNDGQLSLNNHLSASTQCFNKEFSSRLFKPKVQIACKLLLSCYTIILYFNHSFVTYKYCIALLAMIDVQSKLRNISFIE